MAAVAAPCQELQKPPIIAVLDFTSNNIAKADLEVLIDFFSAHILEVKAYRVLDRMQRNALLKEIEFSKSDCSDEACQLQIGKMLSAKYIIVGSLGKVADRYLLNIKLIQVESSETMRAESRRFANMNDLIDQSRDVIFSLLDFKTSPPTVAAPASQLAEKKPEPIPAAAAPKQESQPAAAPAAQTQPRPPDGSPTSRTQPGEPPVVFHASKALFQSPYFTFQGMEYLPDAFGGYEKLLSAIELSGNLSAEFTTLAKEYRDRRTYSFIAFFGGFAVFGVGSTLMSLEVIDKESDYSLKNYTPLILKSLVAVGGAVVTLIGELGWLEIPEKAVSAYNRNYYK